MTTVDVDRSSLVLTGIYMAKGTAVDPLIHAVSCVENEGLSRLGSVLQAVTVRPVCSRRGADTGYAEGKRVAYFCFHSYCHLYASITTNLSDSAVLIRLTCPG